MQEHLHTCKIETDAAGYEEDTEPGAIPETLEVQRPLRMMHTHHQANNIENLPRKSVEMYAKAQLFLGNPQGLLGEDACHVDHTRLGEVPERE